VTAAERRQADMLALLLELAGQLVAELAQVRGELDAMDRGLVEVGRTSDRAVARFEAVSHQLTEIGRITGHPLGPGPSPVRLVGEAELAGRLEAVEQRQADQDEAWRTWAEIQGHREVDQATAAARALPRHGLRALPGGVA
jgi:hypothetical protein